MVKIGFLCEGKTEVKLVSSAKFQQYLTRIGIETIFPIVDVEGGGNLVPGKSDKYLDLIWKGGATKVIILTDLDDDACITSTKNRIAANENRIVIVAVRQIESWFLADSLTLSFLLKEDFTFDKPESQQNPFESLKRLLIEKTGKGIGAKVKCVRFMLKYGFSLENAAKHPNCPSATYFLNKLQQLATE